MTLAKATVTGTVYRAPEKRFTQNDVAIYGLTLSVEGSDDTMLRVISKRKAHSDILDTVKRGDKLLVDGRLQVATVKSVNGAEIKCYEIDANDIELISNGSASVPSDFGEVETVAEPEIMPTFAGEPEITEEALMPEDEIPF